MQANVRSNHNPGISNLGHLADKIGTVLKTSLFGAALVGLAVVSAHADPLHLAGATMGPFGDLGGIWTGNGLIRMQDGAQERIRCYGKYVVETGGNNLQQELRCASDSYKFEMSTNISETGGQLAGIWSENTRHVAGHVTGSANSTTIQARADGDTFTALLAVHTHGDQQSVTISSPGSAIAEVSIQLTRGAK
jgi:hypothetical protein